MAASNADIGHGAKFGIGATPTYVAEVVSITPPGMTRDTVEVTHLESDAMWKEYIGALTDGGEASITVNYVPATAASDALLTAFSTRSAQPFTILAPSGTVKMIFSGIVTAYEPGDFVSGDKMSATFTTKPTGPVEFVAV